MQAVIDQAERLAGWVERKTGIRDVRIVRRMTGGNANVTSLVDSSDGKLVLRHPPAEAVSDLATAGISREYRFVSAIAGRAPVATPVCFCDDPAILGVPFLLSRFVGGEAITDTLPETYADEVATIDAVGHALIDALASVHTITPVPEGLGQIEKAQEFVTRQIARWREVRLQHAVRELPLIDSLGAWLAEHVPTPQSVRIVHCDYHLDNVLMDPAQPQVNAILDWEMATLADPMVDVGLVTAMWNRDETRPRGFGFVQQVSNCPGAVTGAQLAERWSARTGLSDEHLAYFQAFAMWRLAAIVEGAFVLYRQGQVDGAYERGLEHDVPALLDEAARFARQAGKP
ncbi:phosphotransferase family protein [Altererythrobacter sp. GH1-8]|uniref:phosphotransferase family protein n=1 Tax=Altererythrobacter sp. GH1-8 TaxID=3349333 RepID=UPI00374D3A4F